MTEPANVFEYESTLYEFNKFFEFPKNIQAITLKSLKKATQTLLEPGDNPNWNVTEACIQTVYDFARAIDPSYKTWREKTSGYVVNPETERLLINYYEMINNKGPETIRKAIIAIEEKIS